MCSQQGKRPYQEDEYSVSIATKLSTTFSTTEYFNMFHVQIRPFLNQVVPTSSEQDVNIETHFFGLFDGHAGGRCSNYVAGSLPSVLAEDPAFFTNLPQALKRSFHQTNEHFLKVAEKMKYHDGSTGICAVVRDSKVLVANVGDCRCLIISGGRPIQMSIDQKPTNPEEQKRIVALGGQVVYCMGVARVNRVLAVSRAFGNRTLRTVIRPDAEMMQRELTKDDDFIVMASDGLWDVLKNKDVCDMCYSPFAQGSPQVIADELVQSALMRGSMDNVTCVVVKLTDYVQRVVTGRAGVGAGTGGGAGATTAAANGSGPTNFNNLERSISLKNMPRNDGGTGYGTTNGSQRNNFGEGSHSNNNNTSNFTGSGGILPISRQYSTGSIPNRPEQMQSSPHLLAPAMDNYLQPSGSSSSSNRNRAGSGTSDSSFQLPSALQQVGRLSPSAAGIANNRQASGNYSLLYDDDEQTVAMNHLGNSGSKDLSGSSQSQGQGYQGQQPQGGGGGGASMPWMTQQHNSGGAGTGNSNGSPPSFSQTTCSIPYAARRPTTMGGGAGNILNSKNSFTNAMPNLISMFGTSMPQIGSGGGGGASLAALNTGGSGSSPGMSPSAAGQGGAVGGMWNAESDYSSSSVGSSYTDMSSSAGGAGQPGSRVGTANSTSNYQQKSSSSLATMFPMNYRKLPPKK